MGSSPVGAGPSPRVTPPSTTGVMSLRSQLSWGTGCPLKGWGLVGSPMGAASHLSWMAGDPLGDPLIPSWEGEPREEGAASLHPGVPQQCQPLSWAGGWEQGRREAGTTHICPPCRHQRIFGKQLWPSASLGSPHQAGTICWDHQDSWDALSPPVPLVHP